MLSSMSARRNYTCNVCCFVFRIYLKFRSSLIVLTFDIVPQEVLWSIWGYHQRLWSLPLPNVTWHSGTWPYAMTHSIDQTLHQFANLLPTWTLLPILTLLPNLGGFHRTLQRVRVANRGRLLLWTPGPVPFGTCICSNVETILSWTCHVYGPFESRTSLGTSILPLNQVPVTNTPWIIQNLHFTNIIYYFICYRHLWRLYILKINENATLLFSIFFQHGLVNQNFVFTRQLFFTYSIKRVFSVLIDCQCALFKSSYSKTSYPTLCHVPHDWFVFLHRVLLADWVDNISQHENIDISSPYQIFED